jgi:cell division protease FtsH
LKTRTEMEALIYIAFGGMVAEELFFGEASSGVASDLKAATIAACQMIGSLGMGSTLISSAALETGGGGNIVAKVLSNEAGRDEVEDVLRHAKAEVRKLLDTNQHFVEGLRDALLERDELVGAEILEVIASVGSPALESQI